MKVRSIGKKAIKSYKNHKVRILCSTHWENWYKQFEKPRPSEKRIIKMNKRNRHRLFVGEFKQYSSDFTFTFKPLDETSDVGRFKLDSIYEYDQLYNLDVLTSWKLNDDNLVDHVNVTLIKRDGDYLSEDTINQWCDKITSLFDDCKLVYQRLNYDGNWELD